MGGYTELVMVLRRVFVLALMLAVTASPLALTLCQVECATQEASQEQAAAVHHSCHAEAAPAAVTITGVPHACGHTDAAPAGIEGVAQTVTAPLAVMPVVAWSAPSPSITLAPALAVADTAPPPSQRPTQLRV
jgi:hypothetical protein